MKNTPPTWEVEIPDHEREPIRVIVREDHPQGNLTICHVNPHLNDESKANAALISAAPELLAACIEATALFDNYPQAFESIGTYQVLQNAIAKARGEA